MNSIKVHCIAMVGLIARKLSFEHAITGNNDSLLRYVEWSLHEPSQGTFQFTGEQDLEYFLELAVQEGLLVLLRPGPYICAERDFGGLPSWLLTVKPNITLRSKDDVYEFYVKKWFDQLFPRITRFLYGNGGPIILVQVKFI